MHFLFQRLKIYQTVSIALLVLSVAVGSGCGPTKKLKKEQRKIEKLERKIEKKELKKQAKAAKKFEKKSSKIEQINLEKGKEKVVKLKKADQVLALIKVNEFSHSEISLKANLDVVLKGKKNYVTANIRLKEDSAAWFSFSRLGIFAARALVKPDSVLFFNKLESNYFLGDFSLISDKIGIDVEFNILQALLLGNAFGIDEEDKPVVDFKNKNYQISSIKKKKIKKAIKKDSEKIDDDIALTFKVDPENFRVLQTKIYDFRFNKTLTIDYSEFSLINEKWLPTKIIFTAENGEELNVTCDYSKIQTDKNLKFPFKIPEGYSPIF